MTTFEGGASINSEDGIILSGELDQPKRPFQDEHFVLNLTKLQEVPKYFVGNIEIVVDVTDYDHFRISSFQFKLSTFLKWVTRFLHN